MTAAAVWPESLEPMAEAWEDAADVAVTVVARAHVAYRTRPTAWIHERLGVPMRTLHWALNDGYARHVWDGTPEPLLAIADALARGEDVGVESGTGTGKSFLAACLILWFVACWDGARVFTFAPSEDQLRKYIWTEMTKLWPRFSALFPAAALTDLTLRMRGGIDDSWGAWGRTAAIRSGEEVSTRTAGMHAPHMLIVTEETPGIHVSVMEAIKNTCTASHNLRLALGNPDHQLDALHTFCAEPGVTHVRISALDHPNVVTGDESIVPGAVGRKSVTSREREYGTDGRLYLSRVRGISPAEATDALIRLEWLEAAARRYKTPEYRQGAPALGVDVANSESGDDGAMSFWRGACCLQVTAFPCPNANLLGDDVHKLMVEHKISETRVGVDKGGVGAGTVNELTRLGASVQALDMGSKTAGDGAERYLNMRAHVHWLFREDVRLGRIALPYDRELFRELTVIRWEVRNGAIVIEPKDDIKKRLGGKSPNKAEAVMYGNWVRDRSEPVALPPRGEDIHPGFVLLGRRLVVNEGHAGRMAAEQREGASGFKVPGSGWRVPR